MPADDTERFWNQVKALYRGFRRALPSAEGLSPTELQVLSLVDHRPGPSTPGQMATELQMTSPNMAAALRALERRGMVNRRRDPEDGRKSFISATEKGSRIVAEVVTARRQWLRETVVAALTAEQRQQLFDAGDVMQALAEAVVRR